MRNLTDEATGTEFTAAEYNSLKNDIIRIALSAGITLDGPLGPDSSDAHLSQAIATYAQNSSYYTDTGTADNYVLSKGVTNFKEPEAYTEGQVVWTKPLNTNVGASTLKVGGLPIKNITTPSGVALSGGEITAGEYIAFVYRVANDRFEILSSPAAATAASTITNTAVLAAATTVISFADITTGKSRSWFVGIEENVGSLQKNLTVSARVSGSNVDWTVYGVTGDTIPTSIDFTLVANTLSIRLTNNHTGTVDVDAKLTV